MTLRNLNFQISIAKMKESHRETFWLIVSHPDYKSSGKFGSEKGTMTPFMDEDIDKVRYFAQDYAMLFGMTYDQVIDPYVEEYPESPENKEMREEEFEMLNEE